MKGEGNMTMSTVWLVAMHAGHADEGPAGSLLAVLALGVVALVVAAMLRLRARQSGRGAP